MLIGELAERANISTATIRRLEGKGVLTTERDCNGWRIFGPQAVEELRQLYRRDLPGSRRVKAAANDAQ